MALARATLKRWIFLIYYIGHDENRVLISVLIKVVHGLMMFAVIKIGVEHHAIKTRYFQVVYTSWPGNQVHTSAFLLQRRTWSRSIPNMDLILGDPFNMPAS
ncbi:uncharacterized protein BO87DRAFT_448360 [Aspergillus neoniger CBS 115656]|uniref:Uncharacterized protein n=1 Tax=Aspergillus neoniger (strain CBS 115656) TaxID=1448310 RepID=A0A318YUZ2_ASPNB|nr:hypothetical protein BO87DRAFT_448360 [Aspergillus neoniger CBS 115656]PYH37807.1 hypothetical protein BO87DRAFT_448360 [Aspergillus neoniger CBS 115656]